MDFEVRKSLIIWGDRFSLDNQLETIDDYQHPTVTATAAVAVSVQFRAILLSVTVVSAIAVFVL